MSSKVSKTVKAVLLVLCLAVMVGSVFAEQNKPMNNKRHASALNLADDGDSLMDQSIGDDGPTIQAA